MTDDEIIILYSAHEDWCPIWEAKWQFRDRQRGYNAVKSLYEKGLITFHYRTAWIDGEYEKLTPKEIEAVAESLDHDFHWERDPDDLHSGFYLFATTEKGEEANRNDPNVLAYNRRRTKEILGEERAREIFGEETQSG
jgi:hypothetical protein